MDRESLERCYNAPTVPDRGNNGDSNIRFYACVFVLQNASEIIAFFENQSDRDSFATEAIDAHQSATVDVLTWRPEEDGCTTPGSVNLDHVAGITCMVMDSDGD